MEPMSLSRREALSRIACGFGGVALAGLLAEEGRAEDGRAKPGRSPGQDPLAPKKPHFAAKAKRVIFLFMHGGVSHVDSFDPKPALTRDHGKAVKLDHPETR